MTLVRALRGFPLLMARWDELHPYNALDVVELDREVDGESLARAAVETLREAGIGPFELDLDRRRLVLHEPPHRLDVETVDEDLAAFATREMNRRFVPGSLPLRLAASNSSGRSRVALTYWHPTGDGMGSAFLVHRLLARLEGRAGADPVFEAGRIPGPGLLRPVLWARTVARLLERRRCFLPMVPGSLDAACRIQDLSEDTLARLVAGARRRSATVGEVLLALLAVAVSAATASRSGRRQDIAVASAVDLRPEIAPERWQSGVFVATHDVVVPKRHAGSLEDALPIVRARFARLRSTARWRQNLAEIDVANALHPLVPVAERSTYFTHRIALAAGLSNLRPPAPWFDGLGVGRYLRVVPVGPIVPLALGVATVAGRFTTTLTYRTSGYSLAQVEAVEASLSAGLRSL